MINLVTLEQAKIQLSELGSSRDADIQQKIDHVSDIIMDYLEYDDIPDAWLASASPIEYDIPGVIQAATMLEIGEHFLNRESSTSETLSPAVVRLLARYRRPALA